MRWLNIFAALSGAAALVGLASLRHLHADADFNAVLMAAVAQLSAATAGLAVANRGGAANAIAGAMLLSGALIFAGEIYLGAFAGNHAFIMAAPVGGGLMILGWIALAFANPRAR